MNWQRKSHERSKLNQLGFVFCSKWKDMFIGKFVISIEEGISTSTVISRRFSTNSMSLPNILDLIQEWAIPVEAFKGFGQQTRQLHTMFLQNSSWTQPNLQGKMASGRPWTKFSQQIYWAGPSSSAAWSIGKDQDDLSKGLADIFGTKCHLLQRQLTEWAVQTYMFRGFYGKIRWFLGGQNLDFSWCWGLMVISNYIT